MNHTDFETQLRSIAGGMEYPPTPDIAGSVAARLREAAPPRRMNRTFARSLVIAVVLLLSLLIIPPVRAAVLEFIQIGVVRIFRTEPAPAPQEIPFTVMPVTATPAPSEKPLVPLLEKIAGEMTLAEAQQAVQYPILLPTSPAGMRKPDRVFVQEAAAPVTILVWIDPQEPGKVKMSLHLIPEGSWAIKKMDFGDIQETLVNGRRAIWTEGPYWLLLEEGGGQFTRLITGRVLIWEEKDITYRLETDSSLEEAIRTAESLEPVR